MTKFRDLFFNVANRPKLCRTKINIDRSIDAKVLFENAKTRKASEIFGV